MSFSDFDLKLFFVYVKTNELGQKRQSTNMNPKIMMFLKRNHILNLKKHLKNKRAGFKNTTQCFHVEIHAVNNELASH